MQDESISLSYKDARSDKVYHAQLRAAGDGFTVDFQYGRRGGTLAAGTKTAEPVDYVAIGPVFPTRSKDNPDPVVGLEMVRRARAATTRPLVAIGGITRENARSVIEAGADGVAVISDLLDAPDLAQAQRALRAAIGG